MKLTTTVEDSRLNRGRNSSSDDLVVVVVVVVVVVDVALKQYMGLNFEHFALLEYPLILRQY